jgi:hypothetical protein
LFVISRTKSSLQKKNAYQVYSALGHFDLSTLHGHILAYHWSSLFTVISLSIALEHYQGEVSHCLAHLFNRFWTVLSTYGAPILFSFVFIPEEILCNFLIICTTVYFFR